MPFRYKINVIDELKKFGYSSYRIRNEKIIGEGTLSRLRHGEIMSIEVLELLCKLLQMQPGDVIEYVGDSE